MSRFVRLRRKNRGPAPQLRPDLRRDPYSESEDDGIVTKQDTMELQGLQTLQVFIEGSYRTYIRWNKDQRLTTSAELVTISQDVRKIFEEDLQVVVGKSIEIAELGERVGSEALYLCDNIARSVTETELGEFIAGTIEIAKEAQLSVAAVGKELRNIRTAVLGVVRAIDTKLQKRRGPVKKLTSQLSGLKGSLQGIKENLEQQEAFINILVNWWAHVERKLGYTQRSVRMVTLQNNLRKRTVREDWESLQRLYSDYISSMGRLQDLYPAILKADTEM